MSWTLQEAVDYYRRQGAPGQQSALVELLREVQAERGGALPAADLEAIAAALGVRETFLRAVIRRFPSLRAEEAPHRLELCGGPNCSRRSAAQLREWVDRTWAVGDDGVSRSGGFTRQVVGCMKHCGRGPNLRWDGRLYEQADRELLRRLIDGAK